MTIDKDQILIVKKGTALRYPTGGSYVLTLPNDWCKNNGVWHKQPVTFYQVVYSPNLLLIEFEKTDEQ